MKNTVFGNKKRPVLTIVMDGVGYTPNKTGNAVAAADTPTLDMLWEKYPHVLLKAHGTAVGLPSDDDMGNSEVGHNAIGSGQVFAQGAQSLFLRQSQAAKCLIPQHGRNSSQT